MPAISAAWPNVASSETNYGGHVFSESPRVTVYHLPGTTGWGPTYASRPTAIWANPVILGGTVAVQANTLGFTIAWAPDATFVVEASPTLCAHRPGFRFQRTSWLGAFLSSVILSRRPGNGFTGQWRWKRRQTGSSRFSNGDDPGYTNLTDYAWQGVYSMAPTHPAGQRSCPIRGAYVTCMGTCPNGARTGLAHFISSSGRRRVRGRHASLPTATNPGRKRHSAGAACGSQTRSKSKPAKSFGFAVANSPTP